MLSYGAINDIATGCSQQFTITFDNEQKRFRKPTYLFRNLPTRVVYNTQNTFTK